MFISISSLTEHAENTEEGICFTLLPNIAETASMSGMQSCLILDVSEIRQEKKNNSEHSAHSNEVARDIQLFLRRTIKEP